MNKLILTFALISILAVSCSKETTTNTTPTTTTPSTPQPNFGAVDGGLVALNTVTSTSTIAGTFDIALGTGVSVIGNLTAGTYLDAGVITLNGDTLKIQTNKSYVYTPGLTNATGIDLGSSIKWKVGGNAASSVTGFDHTTSKIMPKAGSLNVASADVNTATDFVLSTTSTPINADSVYFQITGGSKAIFKRTAGNVKSVTFTSTELKTLGTGTGTIVVAPWNFETKVYNGKTYAFVNELALSKVITLK